jgi:hypothetical protein
METSRCRYPLSLTPRFRGVWRPGTPAEPFQRFGCAALKPLKRFSLLSPANTQLNLGVNEIRSLT